MKVCTLQVSWAKFKTQYPPTQLLPIWQKTNIWEMNSIVQVFLVQEDCINMNFVYD